MAVAGSEPKRSLRSSRRAGAVVGFFIACLALDWLLFAPSFVFSEPSAAFSPIAFGLPSSAHRSLFGRAYQHALALLLRRPNLDVFRISIEWIWMLLFAVWSAGTRLRAFARVAIVTGYLWLFVFLGYHHAIHYFYWRAPALGEDWRLAVNLLHLISAMMSPSTFVTLVAGGLGLIALGFATSYFVGSLQRVAAGWSLRSKGWLSIGLILPGLLSLAWFGIERDDPVEQLLSKRIVDNWRSSVAEAKRMAPLRDGTVDRRYADYAQRSLRRKPNFYLLMIEAYGEILATWDMRPAYEALLARVQTRLERAGYYARSAYSASPVHGGTSWFSIATVQTGILIDRPLPFSALELNGARVPSLTSFFNAQGYQSYALEAGNRARSTLRRLDLYNHHVVIDATALDYHGPHFGWGHIPDQYSFGVLRERYLAKAPEPRYLFYMGVSTHYPWGDDVPPHVSDWKALDHGQVIRDDVDSTWPALPHTDEVATELRRSYLRSVEYEFRLLTELLEADASRDIVVVILGDHQPRLESNPPGEVTMNTPMHVLSRDRKFVERFAEFGFQPGMFADPDRHPPLAHEGLFSLLVSQLTAAYGNPDAPPIPYLPDGIGLSGLNP